MTARERIQQVTEQWFLTEPLFFAVFCSHSLKMNPNMQCPLRTGQGRIEYNPTKMDEMSNEYLGETLRVEMIRILLNHPYARQPIGCKPEIRHAASDMVIADAYKLAWMPLLHPGDYGLPAGQHYEWYAKRLGEMASSLFGQNKENSGNNSGENGNGNPNGNEDSYGNPNVNGDEIEDVQQIFSSKVSFASKETTQAKSSEVTESTFSNGSDKGYTDLWEEDGFQTQRITDIINGATQWGSLSDGMVELIKKSNEGRIDYRDALRAFRSSILSQHRKLTRMRPSRRFGFDQMGSHFDFTTRLLVAIDTSGSVTNESLSRYFSVIARFFKYGIQEIDVMMFDCALQGKPIMLNEAKKHKTEFHVKGGGGTDFQIVIDYVVKNPGYDGLIIITDGYAPVPNVPPLIGTKLIWVIDNEPSYRQHRAALRKTGRVCLMQL